MHVHSSSFIAQLLFLILLWFVEISNGQRGVNGSELVQLNDCTCPGYTQTFECTVCGSGSTIWNGTFFDCENGIELRHSRYNNIIMDGMDPNGHTSLRVECNQGAVSAKSIGRFNDCYTSQLVITIIWEAMINGTIGCIHDDFTERTIVNQKSLMITEIPNQSPSNVHIESNDPHQITFTWDEDSETVQCLSLQYIITEINCGVCPNITADKSVTCSDTQSQRTNNTCLFAVQTEICGHLWGNRSEYVTVHIDTSAHEPIPNPPRFKLNFGYSSRNVTVEITFLDEAVHDNIERPPVISYTITYTDASSRRDCGSATLPASSCLNGTCCHTFGEISPPCSSDGDISISVFSTSILGDESPSNPLVFSLKIPGSEHATVIVSEKESKELILSIIAASLGAALVLVMAVFIVTVIKLQKDKANMKMLIQSLTVQSSVEIAVKGDMNKGDYENIEICEQKASTKTMDIEVNKNPAYSTIKDL